MRKRTGVGAENFRDLIENGCYYVDKTRLLKKVFSDSQAFVQLITRPRRFGKTLTMSMFESFLDLNRKTPEELSLPKKIFADTWILKRGENPDEDKVKDAFCDRYMGKFPVISLSLKQVEGPDFKTAYKKLAQVVCAYVNEKLVYLKESVRLTGEQKKTLDCLFDLNFLRAEENSDILSGSLWYLTQWLYQHHGIKVIVLIDEYDVPLAKAWSNGYYDQMIALLRAFLGDALKTNANVFKAVITGCLRISKESIFTGINNFAVNSVLNTDKDFASGIGFTKEETCRMLEYFNLEKYSQQVQEHYDGYNFGTVAMVCPWDVVNFCADFSTQNDHENKFIDVPNYWINSSGNDIIEAFLSCRNQKLNEDMQALVAGKTIRIQLNETLSYDDLGNHQSDDFWTLILYTGYLTFDNKRNDIERNVYEVRIPNFEVRESFKDSILNFYKNDLVTVILNLAIVTAALCGRAKFLEDKLTDFLQSYISVRDFAIKAPAENYYHDMLNDIFAGDPKLSDYKSNYESDDDSPNIVFLSKDNRTAVIIELKTADALAEIDEKTALALKQIEDRGYAQIYLKTGFVTNVFAYGICFYKKVCAVMCKKLK